MKNNILFYLGFLFIGVLTVTSCTKDEDKNSFQEITNVQGAVINLSNVVTGFYNLGDPAATISFDVDQFGEDVTSVNLMKSVNGGDPVLETTITSFPSTLTYSLNDALAGTGVDPADVAIGDDVTYSFTMVTTASGAYPSGKTLSVPITCPGQLEGTFDAVTTATGVFTNAGSVYEGTVRMEDVGGGSYKVYSVAPSGDEFEDPSFGAYYVGWGTTSEDGLPNGGGTGNVQVNETCGLVSFTGESQWEEIYMFTNLSVDGAVLNLTWENSYGEGGIVALTRTDGTDWATNLRIN